MGKLIDLTGQRFGFWLVVKQDEENNKGRSQWLCQCECGVQKVITSNSLRTGNSTSCGCNRSSNIVDIRFEKLTVSKADYSKGRKYWLCKCDCGNEVITSAYKLHNKMITSCGCDQVKEVYNAPNNISELLEQSLQFKKNIDLMQKQALNCIKYLESTQKSILMVNETLKIK